MGQKLVPEYIKQVASTVTARPNHADQPFFLFDMDEALGRAKALVIASQKYFSNVRLAISLKSCSLGIFCNLLAQEGLHAKICSADEFHLATNAGFSSERIIWNGSFKNSEDLSLALENNTLIYVDSVHELCQLVKFAKGRKKKCGIGIRLSHFYRNNQYSPFGVTEVEYVRDILPILINSKHVYLSGFQLHVASNVEGPETIRETLRDWLPFLVEHMPISGYLDLSSGLSADSVAPRLAGVTCNSATFFQSIYETLVCHDPSLPEKWSFIFECGCYLSEDSVYAVGKVLNSKDCYGTEVLQTNLAMNWLPSRHSRHHSLAPLGGYDEKLNESEQILAGFNCLENDCLFLQGNHRLRVEQYFIIRGCGSYDWEWMRVRPPIYAWFAGNLLTARMSSSSLVPLCNDLLYKEELIYVTKNIQLCAPTGKFAPALYEIIDFNREYFSNFMAWPKFVNHENDTLVFLDSSLRDHQNNESKTYVILFNAVPVGLLAFNSFDKNNKIAYIGYWLDRRAEGQGIITHSLKKLTAHYATYQSIHRFVIKCSTANQKSNQVALRSGFEYEGTLRQAEYLNGVFHDQNIYGLLLPTGN